MPQHRPKHHWTPEEEEAINRGIANDPDNEELTLEDIAAMRPATEGPPELLELIEAQRRGELRIGPRPFFDSSKVDPYSAEAMEFEFGGYRPHNPAAFYERARNEQRQPARQLRDSDAGSAYAAESDAPPVEE